MSDISELVLATYVGLERCKHSKHAEEVATGRRRGVDALLDHAAYLIAFFARLRCVNWQGRLQLGGFQRANRHARRLARFIILRTWSVSCSTAVASTRLAGLTVA